MQKKRYAVLALTLLSVSTASLALAPVEDASVEGDHTLVQQAPPAEQQAESTSDAQAQTPQTQPDEDEQPTEETAATTAADGDLAAQVARLREQLQNFQHLGLVEQMNALQAQVERLNGRLEEQAHRVAVLDKRLQSYYRDMDQRISGGASTHPQVAAGVDKPASPVQTPVATSSQANQDVALYQQSLQLLRSKQYDAAAQRFHQLLVTYPQSTRVPNTYYWLGEIYLMQGRYAQARAALKRIVDQYTLSAKVPDAMLKLADVERNDGHVKEAMSWLTTLTQRFPNSAAAQVAQARMQQLS